MKREKRYLYLDDFEHRLAVAGMNHFRNHLLQTGKPSSFIRLIHFSIPCM